MEEGSVSDSSGKIIQQKSVETSDLDDENSKESMAPVGTKLCLIGAAGSDPAVVEAAKEFGVEVLTSDDGAEWKGTTSKNVIFVLDAFEGELYESETLPRDCLLGVTALRELASRKQPLPHLRRPLFTLSMFRLIICFTGFRRKEELRRLINLIHHMGGSIRKDMDSDVTHLVAQRCGGDKYTYAMTFRVPVMAASWVHEAWAMRAQPLHDANDPTNLATHRLKPFQGLRVCFLGFPDEEQRHMAEVLAKNGGTHTDHEDPQCSHMVLDSAVTYDLVKSGAWVAHVSPPPSPTHNPLPSSTPMDITPDHPFRQEFAHVRNEISQSSNDAVGKRLSLTPMMSPLSLLNSPVSLARNQTLAPIQESSPIAGSPDKIRVKKELSFSEDDSISPRIGAKRRKTMSPQRKLKKSPRDGLRKFAHSTLRKSFKMKTNSLARWISSSEVCVKQSPLPKVKTEPTPVPPPSVSPLPLLPGAGTEQEDTRMPMVVDESIVSSMPDKTPNQAAIVKAEWFWASVQNEACVDEKEYLFEDIPLPPDSDHSVVSQFLDSLVSPRRTTPVTAGTRARKRKRLREAVAQLAAASSPANNKRRSSVSDAGLLSVSGSFLDCTNSPSVVLSEGEMESVSGETTKPKAEKKSKPKITRKDVFNELVKTESNYVKMLETIINLYKTPLEKMCESDNPLLDKTDVNTMFGDLPPIYKIHQSMLEELREAEARWTEDISVGKIITKFAAQMEKMYRPYINYLTVTQELLKKHDEKNGRFHAFLMIGKSKPESARQPLKELLIRPVQRLPHMILLLTNMLNHTDKSHPDHDALEEALSAVKCAADLINEDKRRTEAQVAIFDIYHSIDKCTAELISSHRSLIVQCELTQLSEGPSDRGRGDSLLFYLFSDAVEICSFKKQKKPFRTLKSPNPMAKQKADDKPYKHVAWMFLTDIKRVIDIVETEECRNAFALLYKEDLKEKFYSFAITNATTNKTEFLRSLCAQVASYTNETGGGMATLDHKALDIATDDIGLGTLGKAKKYGTRLCKQVERALSGRTPSVKLKRAMSTMSPFHGLGLGSQPALPTSATNTTPATQLAQMRLASCNNLNELGSVGTPPAAPTYAAPLSVQPTRRNKHASLSVASLRRL